MNVISIHLKKRQTFNDENSRKSILEVVENLKQKHIYLNGK